MELNASSLLKYIVRRSTVGLSLLLSMLLLIFATPKIATATHVYQIINIWGSYGTGNGQMNYPQGVAADKNNRIYVADTLNHRIQVFDENGNFIGNWGNEGALDGQFSFPYGITVDNNLNVYVADTGNHRIQKFDQNGVFLAKWGGFGTGDGQFHLPMGLETNSLGNVYVADSYNNRIQVFDPAGNFIGKWGSQGFATENGKFDRPFDVAIDSNNNVYISDMLNNRVQKFTLAGGFITKWGFFGDQNGQFNGPHGIAASKDDTIFVVDSENDRVQKFNQNGGFITSWGSSGGAIGQFIFPSGIAVDNNNNVYVDDQWNHRIEKFRLLDTKPGAIIDSIVPNPVNLGQMVNFTGHGFDGNIIAYSWRSSIDGQLSSAATFGTTTLSAGSHIIYFKAQNDLGEWSDEVSAQLVVIPPPAPRLIFPNLTWDSGAGNWDWNASKVITGDFNGDGLFDLAVVYGYATQRQVKIFVFLGNTTNGLDPPREWWSSIPGTWDYSGIKLTSGDYNNDGLADIGILYGYTKERVAAAFVFPSDGTKFVNSLIWWISAPNSWDWIGSQVTTGDFNGDGIDDFAVLYGYFSTRDVRAFVFPSNGIAFTNSLIWFRAGPGNWDWAGSKLSSGDYNNDGIDDLSVFYGYFTERDVRAFIFPSDGGKFLASQIWWHAGPNNWDWRGSMPLSGDLNQDAIEDLIIFYGYLGSRSTVFVFPSNGVSAFNVTQPWYDSGQGNWDWNATIVSYGDFNGDGLGDLVALYNYGGSRTAVFIFR